jgi:dolichol kinase
VHTLAGPLFLLCWPLFSAAPHARFVAAVVPALNGLRLVLAGTGLVPDPRAVSAMTRTGAAQELLRGPLAYVAVLAAVTAGCWRGSPVGLVVTSLMCGGDGLADIVGRRLGGSNPLPWNPAKSWAGSAAMVAGGFGMSMALIAWFGATGHLRLDPARAAAAVAAISVAAAAMESLPINQTVDDNLSVPAVAAALGMLLLPLAAAP